MRNSIPILGFADEELMRGSVVKIKDSNGVVIASTSPVSGQIEIHDNNDGTYYFDVEESFMGTVCVGESETVQQEMANFLFFGDDVLTHLANSGIHLTSSEKSKVAKLPEDTASDLANIITTLSGKASDGDVTSLEQEVDTRASATPGTGMKAETPNKLAPNLNSDYLEVYNGQIRIKQVFSSEEIISQDKTLNQNLERLQKKILETGSPSGIAGYRVLHADTNSDSTPSDDFLSDIVYSATISPGTDYAARKVMYKKMAVDNTLNVAFIHSEGGVSLGAKAIVKVLDTSNAVITQKSLDLVAPTSLEARNIEVGLAALTDGALYSVVVYISIANTTANVSIKNLFITLNS